MDVLSSLIAKHVSVQEMKQKQTALVSADQADGVEEVLRTLLIP